MRPNFESETSGDDQGPRQEGHGEQDNITSEKVETAALQPLDPVHSDDSDESDIVVQDVNVCDICGDAGREDQLATCSRCSDGAEHIYCMRKKLRRVPKGDWLCEECKFAEQTENQKQDIYGSRMKKPVFSTHLSYKRRAENTDAAPSSKRQTLETRVGSPKPSSPQKRTATLLRESSFKSMDKDKLKSSHQTSTTTSDVLETLRSPTTGSRLQTSKGALLKSNSFSMYSKAKVKPGDNIAPQKQESKEHSAVDTKDKAARVMGKSVSFRSPDSGRPNVSESKVKMLPSKFNTLQDLKGVKQVKERSTVDRQNLTRHDRPQVGLTTSSVTVATPKVDQASRGDTSFLSSVSSPREHKTLPSDGKLRGSSLTSGMCSAGSEQKSDQVISNKETSDVGGKSEDMLRSLETTYQTDKTREGSVRCRPIGVSSPKGLFCLTCKEIGHTADSCKSGTLQATVADNSIPRSCIEEVPKVSKLKEAIHAALLRKPEIYRKKSVPDQSNEPLVSNLESSHEVAPPEAVSNLLNNNMCTAEISDGQAIPGSSTSTSDMYKNALQITNPVVPSGVLESGSVVPFMVKSTMRDLQRHASMEMSFLTKTTAIPEYEYIWQGSFELQRDGNSLDIRSGIQAHLSTCASPKVSEVVNEFPLKVPLKEVPRLTVWPTQFHQSGVKEDNIALYFFAKDLESYERDYKSLIDSMIDNDSALKGKFGGVELLILPSNQLPEKSQRWNMLYFLWGVFRETRVHYIDSTRNVGLPGVSLDNGISSAMAVAKNMSVPEHIGVMDGLSGAASASNLPGSPMVSKDLNSKEMHPKELCRNPQENSVLQDSRGDCEHTAKTTHLSGGVTCTTPSLQEVCIRDGRLDTAEYAGNEINGDRMNMIGVAGGHKEEVILEKVNHLDQLKQVRELKTDDGSQEKDTAVGTDLTTRVNSCQSNTRVHPLIDLSETVPSSAANQQMPWNVVNNTQRDGQRECKKPKLDSSVLHGSSTSESLTSTAAEEKSCHEECDEKVIPEDLGTTERHFFPVESRNIQDFWTENNSLPWKKVSSGNEDKSDGFPSLELALRAETKSPSKAVFVGLDDEREVHDKHLVKSEGEKEDDVSASLSLSLSFPFPADKEPSARPVTKSEQLKPERHVNTSLFLFGCFPEN